MQAPIQATESWRITRGIRRHANATESGRIEGLIARIAKRFSRTEDQIADRYSGCGWGDETERHLLDDLFNGSRGSFR